MDFAFTLNPTLAKQMFGAKINGIEKPLTTKVSHLDIVELLVKDQATYTMNDWINFANSSKAQFEINKELA
ncbi:TGS domain-containing protein [Metasolibacillus meyeri]|uniref:TGS domain-containing protein n=1 Tax=Metasolibacillus meyeri TaxID=1071052 RepID=A0AAW9NYL5_9BACL|nr:TGS domain-containing protein [Metasolibacillus meyeri]